MLATMFLAAASAQACPNSTSPDGSCTCSAGCTCCHGGDTNPKVQPPPPEDGVVDILIAGYTFTPFEVEVTQGTTVRWTNLDADLHDTVSQDGLWDSGYLPEGESFSYTFTDDNFAQFGYICTPRRHVRPHRCRAGPRAGERGARNGSHVWCVFFAEASPFLTTLPQPQKDSCDDDPEPARLRDADAA